MIKAMRALKRYAAAGIEDTGLGDSDFRVLEVLLHKGSMPVNTVGPIVDLTPGSISIAVEAGITYKRCQTVNLLDTQIGLVEAEQWVAVILSFWNSGLPPPGADDERADRAAGQPRVLPNYPSWHGTIGRSRRIQSVSQDVRRQMGWRSGYSLTRRTPAEQARRTEESQRAQFLTSAWQAEAP
jgi:hypothetical protein